MANQLYEVALTVDGDGGVRRVFTVNTSGVARAVRMVTAQHELSSASAPEILSISATRLG